MRLTQDMLYQCHMDGSEENNEGCQKHRRPLAANIPKLDIPKLTASMNQMPKCLQRRAASRKPSKTFHPQQVFCNCNDHLPSSKSPLQVGVIRSESVSSLAACKSGLKMLHCCAPRKVAGKAGLGSATGWVAFDEPSPLDAANLLGPEVADQPPLSATDTPPWQAQRPRLLALHKRVAVWSSSMLQVCVV